MVLLTTTVLEATVISDGDWVSVTQICRMYRIEPAELVELADLGLIAQRQGGAGAEVPATQLPRLRIVGSLMRDLGVNASGAALAVELIEARRALEQRIRDLEALGAP